MELYREENLSLVQMNEDHAEELFVLVNDNREYLREWLPWLDTITKAKETNAYILTQLEKFARGEALFQVIFYKEKIVGVVAFNTIDTANSIGYIGYWLDQEVTGKGIMTLAVQDLIRMSFNELHLEKVEVRCAAQNMKSRAIPEKIGFKNEGLIRNAENVNGKMLDHVVYGLLKDD